MSKFKETVLGTIIVARANAMEIAHRITSDCSTFSTHTIQVYVKDCSNAYIDLIVTYLEYITHQEYIE